MFKGLKSKVIIENVQELIENEKLEKSLVKRRIGGKAKITWDDYYNYNEVKLVLYKTCLIFVQEADFLEINMQNMKVSKIISM